MRRFVWIAAVLMTGVGATSLIGCADSSGLELAGIRTGTEDALRQHPAGNPGPSNVAAHILVPFYPDDTDQCGPATIASVLTYWGIPSDMAALKGDMYLPRLRGTLPIDLLLAVQERGLQAEGASGSLQTIKAELNADRPVVALLNLGWGAFLRGHYVVITGYDERQGGVYMHSGLARDLFVPYAEFMTHWEKAGRWMLLVRPTKHYAAVYERSDRRE